MIWWLIATFCAFFVKGLCGFANTLVFNTIMSFGVNNINISPIELILGFPSNIILAWKNRSKIQPRVCIPLAVLVLAGCIPGAFLLKNVDTGSVKILFGAVIIFVGLEMLLRERFGKKEEPKKWVTILIGIASGVLCGLFGIGALLSACVSRMTKDSASFKANICVVFFVDNIFRVCLYAYAGILTLEALKRALILAPMMLVGLGVGMLSGRFLKERTIRVLVILALMISGGALVWMNL